MAEPSEYSEELRQLHSSECLSDKRCRCGDHLRRWRVLKDSPNRGRIFLQCQGAWPMDRSGLSPFCLDWNWEDELSPVPEIFSFSEEYVLHPDARAYFFSKQFMKRNRLKILDLVGCEGRLTVPIRTETNLYFSFAGHRGWRSESIRSQSPAAEHANTNGHVTRGGVRTAGHQPGIQSETPDDTIRGDTQLRFPSGLPLLQSHLQVPI